MCVCVSLITEHSFLDMFASRKVHHQKQPCLTILPTENSCVEEAQAKKMLMLNRLINLRAKMVADQNHTMCKIL